MTLLEIHLDRANSAQKDSLAGLPIAKNTLRGRRSRQGRESSSRRRSVEGPRDVLAQPHGLGLSGKLVEDGRELRQGRAALAFEHQCLSAVHPRRHHPRLQA